MIRLMGLEGVFYKILFFLEISDVIDELSINYISFVKLVNEIYV